ncbi:MAG: hypothetical protein KDD84_18535, partial [Caldilineaceae bacterium]|nr:hypothetical protein [Caldilineaceae bacterium]
ERPLRRRIHVSISDGFVSLPRSVDEDITVAPGESVRLAWPITPTDVVWGRFVLARVYVNRIYPLPSMTNACGVLYVDTALLTGGQFTGLALAVILACLGGGAWLWRGGQTKHRRARSLSSALGALGVVLVLGLAAMLLELWIVAAALLLVAVLLVVVLVVWLLEGGG